MPRAIQELISRYTRDPAWIRIEALAHNAPQVEQVFFEVDRRSKLEALTRIIDLNDFRYGIVFCSTKLMVDDLDEHLHARGYAVDRLHGDISQAQRDRVMDKFRRRGFEFLIATDVAARGLDVDDLEVVFNYDLPNDAEDYTHRIGRTGRAGRSGHAFTFVSGREIYKLQGMIHFAKLQIRRGTIPSIDQIEEARENVFFEKLRSTLDQGEFKKEDRIIDRLLEQGYASTDIAAALLHLMQGQNSSATKAKSIPEISAPTKQEEKPHAPPPAWVPAPKKEAAPQRHAVKPIEHVEPGETPAPKRPAKSKFDRSARTGREPGMTTLRFDVGRDHEVNAGDLVGKIAGVTRLPASVVGAIDLLNDHSLVDVLAEHAGHIVAKLAKVRLKGHALTPSIHAES